MSTQRFTSLLMVDLTIAQLNAEQGSNTADHLRNIANVAADTVCSLYQNAPTGLIPQYGDLTGIGRFTQGLADNLCRDRTQTNPPAPPPFSGGQCPVPYHHRGTWIQGEYSGTFDAGTGYGPITNYRVVLSGGFRGTASAFVDNAVGTPNQRLNVRVAYEGYPNEPQATIIDFRPVRVDGLPDDCGSPPAPSNTRPPVASDYEGTRTVGQPGNTIQVPVTIIPVFAPITNIFRPEFTVDVGGISVTFDLGGVSFHINPGFEFPVTLPPIDPRAVKPPSTLPRSPSSRGAGYDFSKVYKELADIKACACDEEGAIATVTYGLARGRKITLPAKSKYVEITVSDGDAVRIQVSEGDAPDVHFVGWHSFGIASQFGDRVPLSFEGNAVAVPKWATHFCYSLVFGSEASLKVYYET